MVLNDYQISLLCGGAYSLVDPYEPKLVRSVRGQRVLSYGQSSFGYDVRLGTEFMSYHEPSVRESHADRTQVIDPLNFDSDRLLHKYVAHDFVVLPALSYCLAHTLEVISMPTNTTALCIGKSTYARSGVFVNTTPIEAGWSGQITLEISNMAPRPVKIYVGQGIAQLVFWQGQAPNVSYADRGGKYQDQRGVVPPRA